MRSGQELSAALAQLPKQSAEGTAYRIIPARFYLTALSAVGSVKRGGRYNPRGQLEALYLSENPVVALQEVEVVQQTSHELVGLNFGPKTLLSVQYTLSRVLDLTDLEIQRMLGTTTAELIKPWALIQSVSGIAPTQQLGLASQQAGFEALRAPSAKNPGAANLVIFPTTLAPTSTLRVFDDSGFIDASLP